MSTFRDVASAEASTFSTDWLTCMKAVEAVAKAAVEGERIDRRVDIVSQ